MVKYNLFIGIFSPFHNGHKYIIDTFVKNGIPVCIAVRESQEKYPVSLRMAMVKSVYIEEVRSGLVKIISIPDIEQVCVGRDVGYCLTEIPTEIGVMTGTNIKDSIKKEGKYGPVPPEVEELIKGWEDDRNIFS